MLVVFLASDPLRLPLSSTRHHKSIPAPDQAQPCFVGVFSAHIDHYPAGYQYGPLGQASPARSVE
jgi:hypothetical protein